MKCELTERVSALVDGELPDAESAELRTHIQACEECGAAEEDFLFMRRQIKGLGVDEQTAAPIKANFFRRRIAIPAPAFVIGLILISGLVAILYIYRPNAAADSAQIGGREKTGSGPSSLARYDSGGKARIYKEARR